MFIHYLACVLVLLFESFAFLLLFIVFFYQKLINQSRVALLCLVVVVHSLKSVRSSCLLCLLFEP